MARSAFMPSTTIVQLHHRVVPRSGSTRSQQVPLVSFNSLLGGPLAHQVLDDGTAPAPLRLSAAPSRTVLPAAAAATRSSGDPAAWTGHGQHACAPRERPPATAWGRRQETGRRLATMEPAQPRGCAGPSRPACPRWPARPSSPAPMPSGHDRQGRPPADRGEPVEAGVGWPGADCGPGASQRRSGALPPTRFS